MVETDVHFPTDINLLLDAMRKVIILTARLCTSLKLPGWRQSSHNLKKLKGLCQKLSRMRRSNARDEEKRERREQLISETHRAYLDVAREFLGRSEATLAEAGQMDPMAFLMIAEIEGYIVHARRQIDQVDRRVLRGETIPHDEKVFSIFQEHTEWICKGKLGVRQELGIRVCILEDQHGFILHHMVMQEQTDVQVTVPMIKGTLVDFPQLRGCSFDKGFYSRSNRECVNEILDFPVMPKKGKLSAADRELEHSAEFIEARHRHSAVESGINALENHGLDRCPDSGIGGFKRYVALAVLARNIQQLGRKLLDQRRKRERRRDKPPGDFPDLPKIA